MSQRKNAARAKRPTKQQYIDAAYQRGVNAGREMETRVANEKAAAAKAAAPRRSFWIEQTEAGFTLTESTAGSVRGKSWTAAYAEEAGQIIDGLISG